MRSAVLPSRQQQPSPRRAGLAERVFRIRESGILVVLVVFVAVTTGVQHRFLDVSNIQFVLVDTATFALLALGETMVVISRNVDLSVGSVVGLSAYLSAHLFASHPGLPIPVVFLAGLGIGLACGHRQRGDGRRRTGAEPGGDARDALHHPRHRHPDCRRPRGGRQPLSNAFLDIPKDTVGGIPDIAIAVAVIIAIGAYYLRSFRSGRDLYAIGSNPDAARLAGLPVGRRVFTAFAVSGAIAGLAGVLWAAQYGTINSTAGTGYELQVVSAVVVGGVAIFGGSGSITGAAIGALLLTTISSALYVLGISSFWDQAIWGAAAARRHRARPDHHRAPHQRAAASGGPAMSNLAERLQARGSRPGVAGLGPSSLVETGLAVVVILIFAIGSVASPNFLTGNNMFSLGLSNGEIAIMTLPMTLIVISGEIDLSVASILGMSSALLGFLWARGWPMPAIFVTLAVVGILAGAFNGLLVTRLRLPSLAVTIGTLALYRGVALILLGPNTVSSFPDAYTNLGVNAVPFTGNDLTYSTLIFIVGAIIFGVVLHATPFGRSIYAMGASAEAAQFSGIRVKRIKTILYMVSGLVCALRRRAVDVPAQHRRAEQRPRPGAVRRGDRAARRGVHLRRQRLAHRRGARRARLRRHPERPPAHQLQSGSHRHRHRRAAARERLPAQRRPPAAPPASPGAGHRRQPTTTGQAPARLSPATAAITVRPTHDHRNPPLN